MNENAIDRNIVCAFIDGLISDDRERKKGLEYIRSMSPVNPTKTGWIPVSERLPKARYDKCGNLISNEVIIWCEKDSVGGEYEWYDVGFFRPTAECFETVSEEGYFETICHISKVKAWMPLPKPYEPQERSK